MGKIQQNNEYFTALTAVSPNLLKFITRLNEGDKMVRWDRLDKDGCKQSDGTYFRIMGSQRTAKEQVKLFKQGREGVKYDTLVYLLPQAGLCEFANSTKYDIKDRGKVVRKQDISTNAWAGESRHNWGLALDLCIRKFGDNEIIQLSDGPMSLQNYLNLVGIVSLAKDCGLEWGGDWTNFNDIVHFEDTTIDIPDSKYWFNKNMNFTFIRALQQKGIDVSEKKKYGGKFLGVGVLAFLLYKCFGGKR